MPIDVRSNNPLIPSHLDAEGLSAEGSAGRLRHLFGARAH
jgi:hypothetical protein